MYVPTDRDTQHEVWVFGRLGKNVDKAIKVRIYRRTRMEAVAFLISLGYYPVLDV